MRKDKGCCDGRDIGNHEAGRVGQHAVTDIEPTVVVLELIQPGSGQHGRDDCYSQA